MTAQNGVPDLVQRWTAAEQRNDAGALDGLLAGGFAGVGPFGFILTRDQWLARFANGLVNRSFTVTDLQVRDYGTAAVGIGVLFLARAIRRRNGRVRSLLLVLEIICLPIAVTIWQGGRWYVGLPLAVCAALALVLVGRAGLLTPTDDYADDD